MIERLMNLERPCGDPGYSKAVQESEELRSELECLLNQEGQQLLKQLTDLYMRQESIVLRSAFIDGFWAAVELMLEFHQRDHT